MSNVALVFILGLLSIQAQSGVTMLRTNESAQTLDVASPTYSDCLTAIVRFKGLMQKILSAVSFIKDSVAEAKIKQEAAAELQSLSADADEISKKIKSIYASIKSAGFGLVEMSDIWMAAKGVELDRIMVKVSINKLLNIDETAKNVTILISNTAAATNETIENEESSDSQNDDSESADSDDDSSASQENETEKNDETDSQAEASPPYQEIKVPTIQSSANEYIEFFQSIQKKIIKMENKYENCSKKANGVETKEGSDALQQMLKQVPRFQMMVKEVNKMLNESTSMKQEEKAIVRESEDKIGKRIENSLKKMQEQVNKSHPRPQLSIQTNDDSNNAN